MSYIILVNMGDDKHNKPLTYPCREKDKGYVVLTPYTFSTLHDAYEAIRLLQFESRNWDKITKIIAADGATGEPLLEKND